MPKVIENIKDNILDEAKRQMLSDDGYDSMTIRKVANSCGIAVGTVYNYFPSKESLAANVMLSDWQRLIADAVPELEEADPADGVETVFNVISEFTDIYGKMWNKGGAIKSASIFGGDYHRMLVEQIKGLIGIFLKEPKEANLTTFLAEVVIDQGSNGYTDYNDIKPLIEKLIN